MSPPETRNGAADTTRSPVTRQTNPATITKQDHPQDSGPQQVARGLPTVTGTELSPIGGAQFARVLAQHADCGHTHVHIKFEVDARSIVRSPQCAPHTEYRIEIVDVVPAAQSRRTREVA